MMRAWLILAAVLACAAAGAQGYSMGWAANQARHTSIELEQASEREQRQHAILTAEVDARQFALAQEDHSRAEPVQSPACLPASRVLRLNNFAKP